MMKAKRIGVVYNFIRMDSVALGEKTFYSIVNKLEDEGRTVKGRDNNSVTFEDGSKVYKISLGRGMNGIRLTHLYVDDVVFELENGEQYLEEVLMPTIIPSGNYENLDAEGSPKDRLTLF